MEVLSQNFIPEIEEIMANFSLDSWWLGRESNLRARETTPHSYRHANPFGESEFKFELNFSAGH
jgi:hypothetical protein